MSAGEHIKKSLEQGKGEQNAGTASYSLVFIEEVNFQQNLEESERSLVDIWVKSMKTNRTIRSRT
jgi:hypothetical protein